MLNDLPRGGISFVDSLFPTLGIGDDIGLAARPVKVQVGVEVFAVNVES